jgi:hypothetical protein
MLKNVEECFVKKFDKIIWCHGVTTAVPSDAKIFDQSISGFPAQSIEDGTLFNPGENNCLVLDDLMSECGTNPTLTNLFTKVNFHYAILSLTLLIVTDVFLVFSSFQDYGDIFGSKSFFPR